MRPIQFVGIFQNQKRDKLNEITTIVLLCRDQLKITTDRILSQSQQAVQGTGQQATGGQNAEFTPRTRADSEKPTNIPPPRRESEIQPQAEALEEELETNNAVETEDDPLLIFSEENLKQLQTRTEELKTERAMQKNKFKYVSLCFKVEK